MHRLLPAACLILVSAVAVAATDGCSDVRPRSGDGFAVGPDCDAVVKGNDCDRDWVKTSIRELTEGYCQISCGRCPSCRPLDAALRAAGLASVADAAAAHPRWGPAFKSPATMITLLAPTAGLASPSDVDRHVLLSPPAWGNATYTAALLAAADAVPTAAGSSVAVAGGALRSAGGARAAVVKGDVAACKSVVHVTDGAL